MREMVLAVLSVTLGTIMHLTGCSPTAKQIEKYNDPHDDAKLADCQGDARAYCQTREDRCVNNPEASRYAYSIYRACVCDAGLSDCTSKDAGGK